MKTYVIIISEKFPKSHKRSGENTNFINSILHNVKIHTIRSNYEFWKKRVDEINKGEARLSVRVWEGKPYNSKQREVLAYVGVGIQKLRSIDFERGYGFYIGKNGNVLPIETETLAKNDGLSIEDFEEWFDKYDLTKPMAIIHFTNYKY